MKGYIGKPEHARKTRGEQYFFANGRYIRHPYLHHAVVNAFQELIPDNAHPSYFLFMDVDPATIDVNIHPTKTEVKFQDEKMIYGMLRSAVRESLGKSNAMPSIDFDTEKSFELPPGMADRPVRPPEIKINPEFNPFKPQRDLSERERHNREHWTELFSPGDKEEGPVINGGAEDRSAQDGEFRETDGERGNIFQLQRTYIVSSLRSGLLILHQERAHEKILFERFMASLKTRKSITQKQLFPINVHFSPSDAEILRELDEDLRTMGFDIREMGGNSFVVDGIPSDSGGQNIQEMLEVFLDAWKEGKEQNKEQGVSTARAMAQSLAVKAGQRLEKEEMHALIDGLFACNKPETAPDGRPTLMMLRADDLDQRFLLRND